MQQLLLWILTSASLALLLGAAVLWLMPQRKSRSRPLPTEWTLTSRPVFNADERRVYRQLREALPHHIVLSKLPMVRFCQPTDPQEVRFWYRLLGSIHVGFAVCSANGRVLAAIDLDNDRSGSTRRALQIKQSVLAACKVRYLRCTADHLPSIPELQLLVPNTGATVRGPHAAPTVNQARDSLSSTVASRRRERVTLWQDSGSLQDSFFALDGRSDSVMGSGFGGLRPTNGPRDRPAVPPDVGGVVIDTPISQMRH